MSELGPAILASDLAASSAWWSRPPRMTKDVNEDVFNNLVLDVVAAINPYAASMNMDEVCAVLLKALAAVSAASVHHGTDNDVFKLSLDVRENIYSEVMSFRRAINLDAGKGVIDA